MDRRADRRERREESPRRAALPGAGRPDADDHVEESHRWDDCERTSVQLSRAMFIFIKGDLFIILNFNS